MPYKPINVLHVTLSMGRLNGARIIDSRNHKGIIGQFLGISGAII